MKVEALLFAILIPFFGLMGAIYGYFTNFEEPVGTVGFWLVAGLCAFIAFYLWVTGRKVDARPEDDPQGEHWQAEGEFGFYSPHSWWPLWLALALAFLFFAVAVGWWLTLVAIPFVAIASLGFTFEYFRGEDSL